MKINESSITLNAQQHPTTLKPSKHSRMLRIASALPWRTSAPSSNLKAPIFSTYIFWVFKCTDTWTCAQKSLKLQHLFSAPEMIWNVTQSHEMSNIRMLCTQTQTWNQDHTIPHRFKFSNSLLQLCHSMGEWLWVTTGLYLFQQCSWGHGPLPILRGASYRESWMRSEAEAKEKAKKARFLWQSDSLIICPFLWQSDSPFQFSIILSIFSNLLSFSEKNISVEGANLRLGLALLGDLVCRQTAGGLAQRGDEATRLWQRLGAGDKLRLSSAWMNSLNCNELYILYMFYLSVFNIP